MPRQRSPKRDLAYRLWLDSEKKRKLKDIAEEIGVSESQVRKWKNQDNWNGNVTKQSKSNVTKRKKGGQPGNKNAVGGNQTGPVGHRNAEKYGLFSKHLPEETLDIVKSVDDMNPLDVLWDQIAIQYAAIIRAQKIMYVKDNKDKTKEMIAVGAESIAYKTDQAYEKQAGFLQAQARAMTSLNSMIKNYDELLHKNWELATEEQKARVENIKASTAKIKGEDPEEKREDDGFIEALKGEASEIWQE